MIEFNEKRPAGERRGDKRLSPQIEEKILRAIGRLDYGSVEVIVHDGKVVQIECREKMRLSCDEPDRKSVPRQISQTG